MSEGLLQSLAGSVGSTIVHVDDVTDVALELADRLDGELVEGDQAFLEAVRRRHLGLGERVSAHAALELRVRDESAPPEHHVVNDLGGLRSLVRRIEAADHLVAGARSDASDRAGAASGLAVHPTSIRDAAAEVWSARAKVAECQAETDRLVAETDTTTQPETPASGLRATDAAGGSDPADEEPRTFAGWRLTDRDEIRWAAVVVVAAVAIGVLVLVLTGSPLALAVPGVAMCWAVVLVVRQRDDAYDEEMASRNLAAVSRLTDQAYGGAGLAAAEDPEPPTLLAARRALAEAEDRLAYAESSWRSLVGPDADVDDVESVVQARDAQYGVSDEVVAQLPTLRAAAAHRRRLRAQWKLAWWALDRPVPADAEALERIDALRDEGITEISVPAFTAGALTDHERVLLDQLAQGRSDDELRAAAASSFAPVVVVDADGVISSERLRAETAQLPSDVRFVVVAPTH